MCKCKNEKEKVRKNNARMKEKKKVKEAKNYTLALGELKWFIPRKNDLSLELNKAASLWISELREVHILGPWKRSEISLHLSCGRANGRNSYF